MKAFKSCSFTVRGIDPAKHTVTAIVSTGSIDRDREKILPSAFQARLGEYKRNPVLCWGHPLSAMCEAPGPDKIIGRATSVEVTDEGLLCTFQYAVKENPTAALCYRLVQGGYLSAYSIGALAHGAIDRNSPEEIKAQLSPDDRTDLEEGRVKKVYTDMELVEVSHVFVGSNRDALVSAALDGDEEALAMLAKSGDVNSNDLLHRGALLLRKMTSDVSRVLSEMAELRKMLVQRAEEPENPEEPPDETQEEAPEVCPMCGQPMEPKAQEEPPDEDAEQKALDEIIGDPEMGSMLLALVS